VDGIFVLSQCLVDDTFRNVEYFAHPKLDLHDWISQGFLRQVFARAIGQDESTDRIVKSPRFPAFARLFTELVSVKSALSLANEELDIVVVGSQALSLFRSHVGVTSD